VCEPGVQQPVIECRVIGEDQQSLAIEIQPANGINVAGNGEEILERLLSFLRGELRKNLEWFVYNVVLVHVCGEWMLVTFA
jgi:hypothetical protein